MSPDLSLFTPPLDAWGIATAPGSWTQRMNAVVHYEQDTSAEGRSGVWREAFGIALARPLTGSGHKSTATSSVLHRFHPNAEKRAIDGVWLEGLRENDYPACLVGLGMLVLGFVNAYRIRQLSRGDSRLGRAEDFACIAHLTLIPFAIAGIFFSIGYYDFYIDLLVALAAIRELVVKTVDAAAPGRVVH